MPSYPDINLGGWEWVQAWWPEGSLTAVCGMLRERLNVLVPTRPPDQLNQGLGGDLGNSMFRCPSESESPQPGLF